MAISVKKREKETISALLRRFNRRIQQSRILVQAKKARFYEKSKSKRQIKESALRREEIRKLRERLIKMGLLEERQLIPKDKLNIKKK